MPRPLLGAVAIKWSVVALNEFYGKRDRPYPVMPDRPVPVLTHLPPDKKQSPSSKHVAPVAEAVGADAVPVAELVVALPLQVLYRSERKHGRLSMMRDVVIVLLPGDLA